MNINDLLKKINELAKKQKERTLTDDEKQLQHQLRQQYLEEFRKNFLNELKMIKVVNEKGEDVTPEKLKKLNHQNQKIKSIKKKW